MPPHRSSKTITGASRPNVFDLAGLLIRSWVSAGSRGHAAVVHVAGRPSIARERPAIEMLRPSARLALSAFGVAGAPGPDVSEKHWTPQEQVSSRQPEGAARTSPANAAAA